jgi:hypothetical protein
MPVYTYFQNLMIQAVHFSYPEAFALARKGDADFLRPTVCYDVISSGGVNLGLIST